MTEMNEQKKVLNNTLKTKKVKNYQIRKNLLLKCYKSMKKHNLESFYLKFLLRNEQKKVKKIS